MTSPAWTATQLLWDLQLLQCHETGHLQQCKGWWCNFKSGRKSVSDASGIRGFNATLRFICNSHRLAVEHTWSLKDKLNLLFDVVDVVSEFPVRAIAKAIHIVASCRELPHVSWTGQKMSDNKKKSWVDLWSMFYRVLQAYDSCNIEMYQIWHLWFK